MRIKLSFPIIFSLALARAGVQHFRRERKHGDRGRKIR